MTPKSVNLENVCDVMAEDGLLTASREKEDWLREARVNLEAVRELGISLPPDIENGEAQRKALARKHA